MRERMDLDWRDLRLFLAIVRAGSLTAASRRLGVNQSTVSRRLLALEEAVGTRLLERTPEGYRPTAAGERVLPAAERLEAEAFACERALTGLERRVEGTVRLTATEGVATAFVAPALEPLRRAHPALEVEVLVDSRALSLSRREADLALRLARPRQPGLVTRRLAEIASALYASPRYLAERGRPRTEDGLRGHAVLAYDESLAAVPEARWIASKAREAERVLRTNSVLVQLQAARAGLGLALLPCYLAEGAGLERALPLAAGIRRELWLAVHADLRGTARIRAVIDFLAARAKGYAAWLAGRRPAA
jgi:DNA-binding transcriptional LysR family regulator